jgi:ubiquinone/menaquinone biosynthesis C-methylase UbiE
MSFLHINPEPIFRERLQRMFLKYKTLSQADPEADIRASIESLPFENATYDIVFASHVLEHIKDDIRAIGEIRRVIKPGGLAVLPVPIISPYTIEYPTPNPHEFGHVRAAGLDYFDRYGELFAGVMIFDSSQFSPRYQLYTYEDRSLYPTEFSPLRVASSGIRHLDYVPVCYR